MNVNRRSVVKSIGTGVLLVGLGARSAVAHPKKSTTEGHPGCQTYLPGPSRTVGDGTVTAYVTTNKRGKLSSVGVHISEDALAAFESAETSGYHLDFPEDEPTGPFEFVGFHWNEQGHEPPEIYDVPHFDFHFNFLPEEDVEGIEFGYAEYDVPSELMPANNVTSAALDQPRVVVRQMGEHLIDLTAPELQHLVDPDLDPIPFTHTHIWGAYDPAMLEGTSDDEGETIFMEPMITLEFLQNLEEEVTVPINVPAAFAVAGDYPTEYVIVPSHGGVYVALDGFQSFPGPSA